MNPRSNLQIKEEGNDYERQQVNPLRSNDNHKDQSSFIKVLNVQSISLNEMEQLNRGPILENPLVIMKQRLGKIPVKSSNFQEIMESPRTSNFASSILINQHQSNETSNVLGDLTFQSKPKFFMPQNNLNENVKRKPGRPRIHPVIDKIKRGPGRPRIHPLGLDETGTPSIKPYQTVGPQNFHIPETSSILGLSRQTDVIDLSSSQEVNDSKRTLHSAGNVWTGQQESNQMGHSIFNGTIFNEMAGVCMQQSLIPQTSQVLDEHMKKRRGRPRIHPLIINKIKRGPGRPRIHPLIINKIPRKRGRPVGSKNQKIKDPQNFDASFTCTSTNQELDASITSLNLLNADASDTSTSLEFAAQTDHYKRRRGRPRKSEETQNIYVPEIQMNLDLTEQSDPFIIPNVKKNDESSQICSLVTNFSMEQKTNQAKECYEHLESQEQKS